MPQTIEYRRPGAVEKSQLSLAAAMRTRERDYQACAWTMLAFGMPAMLAGPLLATAIAAGIQKQFYAPGVGLAWWTWLAIASAMLLPLLFWCEVRTRGRWFEDEVRGQGTTPADLWQSSSRGEWELRTTAASWAALFELLLWGPRMVLAARDRFRGNVPSAVIADATVAINYLRHFAGGVATDELPVVRTETALQYLVTRDWVGVSRSGDRVWLLSDARRALGFRV
ncbi:MAG: hypothetical protein ABIP55_04555 [Tepidisphaeraceae bacterium]